MEKVNGIGGFFFRARDPAALSQWYNDQLSVTVVASNYEEFPGSKKRGQRHLLLFQRPRLILGTAARVG